MPDYQTLNLSSHCNVGAEILGENANPAIGEQTFHGLPFQISENEDCFLGFGNKVNSEPVTIPLNATPKRIIVAHRLLESQIFEGDPVGRLIANYIFRYANGERVNVPIRERFEIAVVPPGWGQLPFLAWPDQQDGLHPRYEGDWSAAGNRQTEATQAWPSNYYLWVWENPNPSEPLESLQIVPAGPAFILAAVTLGNLDEDPIPRKAMRDVMITLPQEEDAAKPFRMEVDVDRGMATYPYPLPEKSGDEFLDDERKGWGEPQNHSSSPAHVEVTATPSATVTVKNHDETLGALKWGDLEEKGKVAPNERVQVELVWTQAEIGFTQRWSMMKPINRFHAASTSALQKGCRMHRTGTTHTSTQTTAPGILMSAEMSGWDRSPTPIPTGGVKVGCHAAR